MLELIGLFLLLSGFVVGLGAVTVIDIHGLLARKSAYWTEATTRTHKVTKPMIWAGILLAVVGGAFFYAHQSFSVVPIIHVVIAFMLVVNGLFLSFSVSPFLLKREREGRSSELLPQSWQRRITVSLVLSDIGWWLGLFLLAYYLLSR